MGTRNGRFRDLTGRVFGLLTVVRCVEVRKGPKGTTRWLCQCACGKNKTIDAQSLVKGKTKSCGCMTQELINQSRVGRAKKVMSKDRAIHSLYAQYKRGAKTRNLYFGLTVEDFSTLIQRECFYCGASPSRILKRSRQLSDLLYNGIDRFINSEGYVLSNCVACCFRCNFKKNSDNGDDFLKWIETIYLNTRGKIL